MEELKVWFTLNLLGYSFDVTSALLIQWVIIVSVLILSMLYSRTLKKHPGRLQTAIEAGIEFTVKTVEENMGHDSKKFVPYIGALAIYLFLLNMVGLFGVKPPTADYSVSLGLAITSFLVIQGYTIKKLGIRGYFKGYASPLAVLLPINVMERIMLPVSLSLRLYGNIFAAAMIMELIYEALLGFNIITAIAIPIPFHFYFDLFDGTIQMVIFVMLTMINIKITAEH
ncbi:MAG: F0F1 ATP synthase subunit A [Clostridium sp.]